MRITLTKRQARLAIQALYWAQNEDYPDSDPDNMAYQRIIDKLEKELGEYYG